MDSNIKEIFPLAQQILDKTKSGEYKWESMGSKSYCLLAGDFSFSVKSKDYMTRLNLGTPVFRFLNKDKCLFEYAPTLTNRDPEFDKLISELSDCVEKKYSEQLKSDMQKALDALNGTTLGTK